MKKYRSAIIGCGRIGSEFDIKKPVKTAFSHAGSYSIFPGTSLVAVSDLEKSKLDSAKKKWAVDSAYLDYKEMLKNEHIDILSVCTPPETHEPIIKYVSTFPLKAILCEKPISNNTKDAQNIIRICKEKKILLMVNHQRRFAPFFKELREKMLSEKFGKVQQVNCYYTRGIFNTGSHIIDLFSFLFGFPEWLTASYSQSNSPFKYDPNLDASIKFKNGPLASMRACDDSCYLILEMDILTSKARIRLGKEFEYFEVSTGKNLLKRHELMKTKIPPFQHAYGPVSLTYGIGHIINCLEHKEKPVSSGEDAFCSLKIIEAMLSSANSEERHHFK